MPKVSWGEAKAKGRKENVIRLYIMSFGGFFNSQQPTVIPGFSPQVVDASAPQRVVMSQFGFSPQFKPRVVPGEATVPIGMTDRVGIMGNMNWASCFSRDKQSGITDRGTPTVGALVAPFTDNFRDKLINENYQQINSGRFFGQNPKLDIRSTATC